MTLAFLGDAVYEQMVRERLVLIANMPVNNLHRAAVKKVCAVYQSKAYEAVSPLLTEEETAIIKRGRNASNHAVPKNSNPIDYRRATGLECLFGYLHLLGDKDRMEALFQVIWDLDDEE